ncbi:hypothetical protein EUX98_g6936 [Antrodiella citrinella]|uniref:Late embryogenesis abundant protein LEA-2 subgroup domain-containing protein n=1 Tax=Antrodiella citrinella TaxID=2447956 RepID=A0A4S4MN20_9APHY|nr:hypothetical protein EUX98_g6936 [Antrodiella citrinella]
MATYGQYSDQQDHHYNPYDNDAQPHQSYVQSGYNDAAGYGASYRDDEPTIAPVPVNKEREERSVFEDSPNFTGSVEPNIVMTLLLWVEPPNVTISDITPPTDGSAVQITDGPGVTVNLGVNISVSNPNFFSVKFTDIKADVFYPINNTLLGGGEVKNLEIKSNSATNFSLPFQLNYTLAEDPNLSILEDLASRCGFVSGSTTSQISVNYKITVAFRVLFIPIKPTISNTIKFNCPFTASQIEGLLKSAGLGDLSSILPTLLKLF